MFPSILSTGLLVLALTLAAFIGGGLGELASGILQVLVLLAVAIRLVFRPRDERGWAAVPGFWSLAAFVVLLILSTVTSRSLYFSLNQSVVYITCLAAYILSASLCRGSKISAVVLWALVLSALAVSGFGVQGYILRAGGGAGFWNALTSPGDHDRLFGPFINPNFFSGYLVLVMPATLALFLSTRRSAIAAFPAIAFVFEVIALLLTGAKFGVVAAVAALLVFVLLALVLKTLDRARLIRLAVVVAILLPLLFPFSAPVKSRVQEAQTGGTQVHSTAFRVYTWKATLHMIKAQPLLGVGPGAYAITYPQYTIAGPTKMAHNSYLQLAAETGVPALVVFLGLLIAVAWKSLRGMFGGATEEQPALPASDSISWIDFVPTNWRLICCGIFAGIAGSCVRSLVDSDWSLIAIALPFWIMAGVLVARAGAAEREVRPANVSQWVLLALCAALILVSVTFGLGDYFGSQANALMEKSAPEWVIVENLRKAVAVSPLDPRYHRLLGRWLGPENPEAYEQISTAIELARRTSEGGWKERGIWTGARREWPEAITSFKTALKYSPYSTETLSMLATAYRESGDVASYETALRRLLEIEKSPYERIKGTPEIVDTTFADAHAYFGEKYLKTRNYPAAVGEFQAAIKRLEVWRSSDMMRKLQQSMGISNPEEDRSRLSLLRTCYIELSEAYTDMGRKADADEALGKVRKVK